MGYDNYKKLKQVVNKFGLKVRHATLFKNIDPIEPSAWLTPNFSDCV